jgi:hypothetical protein
MSVYGAENLIYLIADRPNLAGRFRDLILRAMLERARVMDEEAGYTPSAAPNGFYFCDDNCALLNAEMYEFFGTLHVQPPRGGQHGRRVLPGRRDGP